MSRLREYALAGLLVLALAGCVGIWLHGHAEVRAVIRDLTAKHAQEVRALIERWQQEHAARTTEAARSAALQRSLDHAHAQSAVDARHALLAARQLAGLRSAAKAAANAAARAPAPDTAPASGGPPAAGPGLVLADVLGKCGGRLADMAAELDRSRTAGATCERAYDALTPAPTVGPKANEQD